MSENFGKVLNFPKVLGVNTIAEQGSKKNKMITSFKNWLSRVLLVMEEPVLDNELNHKVIDHLLKMIGTLQKSMEKNGINLSDNNRKFLLGDSGFLTIISGIEDGDILLSYKELGLDLKQLDLLKRYSYLILGIDNLTKLLVFDSNEQLIYNQDNIGSIILETKLFFQYSLGYSPLLSKIGISEHFFESIKKLYLSFGDLVRTTNKNNFNTVINHHGLVFDCEKLVHFWKISNGLHLKTIK